LGSLLGNNAGGGCGFVTNVSSNSEDDLDENESVTLDEDCGSTALDTVEVTIPLS